MPRLRTEMRKVDGGHPVGGADAQDLTGLHAGKPFACPQDGQGAEQPLTINLDVPRRCHMRDIAQALQCGHGNVTYGCGDGAGRSGYLLEHVRV